MTDPNDAPVAQPEECAASNRDAEGSIPSGGSTEPEEEKGPTCGSCLHWEGPLQLRSRLGTAGPVGECHEGPPGTSKPDDWPVTSESRVCSRHPAFHQSTRSFLFPAATR